MAIKKNVLKSPKKELTIAQLKKKAQTVVNAFIRERDEDDVCISCGKPKILQAGHLFNVKNYSALRYDVDNINGECAFCNAFNESHCVWYSINLRNKIGDERFNALLNKSLTPKKDWTREELNDIIEKYKWYHIRNKN